MTQDTRDCPRRGKWIGGCKFQARYNKDEQPMTVEQIRALEQFTQMFTLADEAVDAIRAAQGTSKTYIGDICIRCGRWVNTPLTGVDEAGK